MKLPAVINVLRPGQWIKNLLVLAGFLFALADQSQPLEIEVSLVRTLLAFVIFCFTTGCVYILNDLHDVEADRLHPEKCHRPIASGALRPRTAILEAVALLTLCGLGAAALGKAFFVCVAGYFLLQLLYTMVLKNHVLLDVCTIAAGFSIRVLGGVVSARVGTSAWIYICTFNMALVLALCKRRAELVTLGELAPRHRAVLSLYTTNLLDILISAATASALICYMLWTLSPTTIQKFGTQYMGLTIPFAVYGIFRYLFLVYTKNAGGRPEKLITRDVPLLLDVLLYGLTYLLLWLLA